MEKERIFCPNCGTAEQNRDAYCRHCGEWVPDIGNRRRGRFRASTREDKIRRMRILQLVSIGLSLASTAVIILFLRGNFDRGILGVAAMFGFLVAVYQIISLILGAKVLTPKVERSETPVRSEVAGNVIPAKSLAPAETREFISPPSVIEDTTELLDPVRLRENDR